MMKRRDLLKGLTVTAGSALCVTPPWNIAYGQAENPGRPRLATPIRALMRTENGFAQPLQISVSNSGGAAIAITKLDGAEIDRRTIQSGQNIFDIHLKPASAARHATVSVEMNDAQQSESVTIKPVRKMLIYVLPHSHHDLGYTDLQADVEEKQMQNINRGIELARKTADYPEGARFVWNLEVLWGADLFLQRRSQEEKTAFFEAVRKGWVSLNGAYANELTGLCRPEELLQLFRFSTALGKQCGVRVNSAMMSDVPGFTWGTVAAFAQAGIRYFSAAPNYFDRIGTFMVTWQDRPFWWIGPSGKDKVLFWVPWTGYALSHINKLGPDFVADYQNRMDDVRYPYDISSMRWSGHGDNAEPDPELSEFVRAWNEKYEWPRFFISSVSTAFSAFEKRYGKKLPRYRGDLTPYWEDGAGSSALETGLNRGAADRLSAAWALSAIKSSAYAPAAYDAAWRDVLLYSEHTWGAWCSVSDSENDFTKKQWAVKQAFAVDADKASRDLLKSAADSGVPTAKSSAIQIYNPTSWDRTEIVTLTPELSAASDRVTDHAGRPVPSQRLSTGELAVLVTNVPAFGSAAYTLAAEEAHRQGQAVTVEDGVLDNGLVRAKIDSASGNIVELNLRGNAQNLVDRAKGNGLNEYLFLAGSDVSQVQRSGPATIIVEERGPLVTAIRIESSAPGCKRLVKRLRLDAGADHLEITNIVDKERAPLNPHPGVGGPADAFAQRGSKESVQFAFPLSVPGGEMTMDVPLGNMRPEADQLPGSCKNWLPVGRWIDVSNKDYGVTWASLDAPLVEIGGISATMLGSQRDPSVWRKRIEPTQSFYSWVMNNHWGTNYRAYQEGPVEFRYALRLHKGHNAGAANRFAIGLSQPLQPASGSDAQSASLLRLQPNDVLALTLKPSDDGKAWIVRLFNASADAQKATLTWPGRAVGRTWRSNLAEEQLAALPGEIALGAWELATLRIDRT
ncbi:MAG TPA: glycoside hydrolase family 38 C-terminal domain-containing protein [Rhizomicrobium sp.]|nr:glycoside hydrolase family 38 C-terminal domain-containing protein [Rhizomicrobium sp.]